MFKLIFKLALPAPKLLNYERYCFVAPHPDDIEIGAGGTVARLKALGKHVTYIIATDGRYGGETPDVLPEDLVITREAEARAAAAHLGADEIVMLGFRDGGRYGQAELTDQIALALAKAAPDIVFTVDHLVPTELHMDHLRVGKAVSDVFIHIANHHYIKDLGGTACEKAPAGIAYWFTDRPNRYVRLKKRDFDRQVEAVALHKSQMFAYGKKTLADMFRLLTIVRQLRFGLRRFSLRAEGFRVLATLHAHGAPEFCEKSLLGKY
ncbi:MAG: PIG-L family deacetylase [Firmicutes bacterium]|nr:PIG-L family deacetylase [Bacillota bacterium]